MGHSLALLPVEAFRIWVEYLIAVSRAPTAAPRRKIPRPVQGSKGEVDVALNIGRGISGNTEKSDLFQKTNSRSGCLELG
jgi:hypothetical protein